ASPVAEQLAEFEPRDREQINNLQNTDRVHHDDDNEPPRLAAASTVPERKPLPKHRPKHQQDQRRRKYSHGYRQMRRPPVIRKLLEYVHVFTRTWIVSCAGSSFSAPTSWLSSRRGSL